MALNSFYLFPNLIAEAPSGKVAPKIIQAVHPKILQQVFRELFLDLKKIFRELLRQIFQNFLFLEFQKHSNVHARIILREELHDFPEVFFFQLTIALLEFLLVLREFFPVNSYRTRGFFENIL